MFKELVLWLFKLIAPELFSHWFAELDPNKFYMLVVSNDLSAEDLKAALAPHQSNLNMVVIMADDVHLLELTNKK